MEAIAAVITGDGDTALLSAADQLDDKAFGFELGYASAQDQTRRRAWPVGVEAEHVSPGSA